MTETKQPSVDAQCPQCNSANVYLTAASAAIHPWQHYCGDCGARWYIDANHCTVGLESGTLAAERLAQRFHEVYERLAPSFGYETRKASAKPWSEVPEHNRRLMIAVCAELFPPPPDTYEMAGRILDGSLDIRDALASLSMEPAPAPAFAPNCAETVDSRLYRDMVRQREELRTAAEKTVRAWEMERTVYGSAGFTHHDRYEALQGALANLRFVVRNADTPREEPTGA